MTAPLSPIGKAVGDGDGAVGNFYGGIVVDRPATEAERLSIQDWLAGLIGGLALVALLVDLGSGDPVLDLRSGADTELTVDAANSRFDWLDGTTTLSLADLQAGPVPVVAPSWSGPAAPLPGDVLSPRLPVWAYLDGDVPAITREWVAGTVAEPGEPWPSRRLLHMFTVPGGAYYGGLVYRETAANAAGTRSAAVQVITPG